MENTSYYSQNIGHHLIERVTISFSTNDNPAHPNDDEIYDKEWIDIYNKFHVKNNDTGWSKLMGEPFDNNSNKNKKDDK